MNIKSPEAHELAKRLATLEHTTVTEAVTKSLREALARRDRTTASAQRHQHVDTLIQRMQQQYRHTPETSLHEAVDALGDPTLCRLLGDFLDAALVTIEPATAE
jgi:hypothetical protein